MSNVCACFLFAANAVNPREPALDALMEHLKTNIANKKSKNVDILFLAQEVGPMLKTGDKFIFSESPQISLSPERDNML